MASVADILLHEADSLARLRAQRGEIWGGAIANAGGEIAQALGPEAQLRREQLESVKRAKEGQKRAQQVLSQFKRNDDGTYDAGGLLQQLSATGQVPIEEQERLVKSVDGINGVIRQAKSDQLDRIADATHVLLTTHKGQKISPDAVHLTAESLRGSVLHGDDLDKFTTMMGQQGGDDMTPFLRSVRGLSKKYDYLKKPMTTAQGAVTTTEERAEAGEPPLVMGQPKPPTETEVALKATGGDPAEAMKLLKPQTMGATEWDTALKATGGDPVKAMQMVKTPVQAPTAVAHQTAAEELGRQKESREAADSSARLALERARLDLERKKLEGSEDVGVGADVRTTATGRSFVDLSKYKGKDYHAAQQQAKHAGVFGASKEEADALQNLDVARQNVALIEAHLNKLPTSAGSRVVAGPLNKLQAYFQTDEDLAAWGTWRTAAIQAMRALAGSKGLRINRSEIEASTENDIPKITDTLATAKEKLTRVRSMLTSQENGVMGQASTPNRIYYDANGNPVKR